MFILFSVILLFPMQIDTEEPVVIEQIAEPTIIKSAVTANKIAIQIKEEPVNRWNIELTEDEIDMLAKIVFLEAHTESDDGISAVIEVIFNRMISDSFPDTIEGVLSQSKPCVQFTTWKNLDIAEPTEKEYNMIYAALDGEKEILTTEYIFFGRGKQNNNDPIQIGNHWFCKE